MLFTVHSCNFSQPISQPTSRREFQPPILLTHLHHLLPSYQCDWYIGSKLGGVDDEAVIQLDDGRSLSGMSFRKYTYAASSGERLGLGIHLYHLPW
jgi:hypothetical protein